LNYLIYKGNFSAKLIERLEQLLFPWCKFTTVFDNKEKNLYFFVKNQQNIFA